MDHPEPDLRYIISIKVMLIVFDFYETVNIQQFNELKSCKFESINDDHCALV